MRVFASLLLLLLINICNAHPSADIPDCVEATLISQVNNFCSADAQYATTAAKPTYWFKFVATKYDVNITVSGATLASPEITLSADCSGTQLPGTSTITDNVTSFYKGGLIVGATYYIAVSSSSGVPGSFKLCINNYNPVLQAGQDYATALLLCSTQTISQSKVSGAGNNNNESMGTCLDNPGQANEQNTVWYKWKAANSGNLVFTLTPNKKTDDLDFVLYDLGLTDDEANINAVNAVRCAAGSGVSCNSGPSYYKTGLDFHDFDLSEPGGCGAGQNGKVEYLTLQQGHYYALLVNNFVSQNSGFTLEFADQEGVRGDAVFAGPKAAIDQVSLNSCEPKQSFVFTSQATNYESLKWNFGADASITSANGIGPYTITYTTPGPKTVTLEASTANGCIDVDFKTFNVGQKPTPPQIIANKPSFCLQDNLVLSASQQPGDTYLWTGPNNFTSDSPEVNIPITSKQQAGVYKLYLTRGGCTSDPSSITIPEIYDAPQASFYTEPAAPAKLSIPAIVKFYNQSTDADSYLWDFGDGVTSSDFSPQHSYGVKGTYKVTLTAFKQSACSASITKGDYILLDGGGLLIPNTFTPNGDGINDEFIVSLTDLVNYNIRIFSRYGETLFQSQSTFNSWDGNFHGSPVPVGVYYYVIKAADLRGNPVDRSGYVTVIR
ncbi:T9SS type B sorting domain-containing protein [Mucilaginibacter agri]|uniref:T9SS type B sorting domain-containing protein n=1 Tax=Mucilaginibacter agri TaxID=2695265 RepID=A0A965ZCY9_9SPHI|nr:gliding motility-associated C-terminal domain-containing protein [Mucilaginibacter agri]NCD68450.1 T9SS type B sorting domain-containing protein [Mucilaginibacter agri]